MELGRGFYDLVHDWVDTNNDGTIGAMEYLDLLTFGSPVKIGGRWIYQAFQDGNKKRKHAEMNLAPPAARRNLQQAFNDAAYNANSGAYGGWNHIQQILGINMPSKSIHTVDHLQSMASEVTFEEPVINNAEGSEPASLANDFKEGMLGIASHQAGLVAKLGLMLKNMANKPKVIKRKRRVIKRRTPRRYSRPKYYRRTYRTAGWKRKYRRRY